MPRRVLPAFFLCIGLALTFAMHVAIARMLSSGEAYGQFAFYRSVSLVIALIATLGLPGVLLRQIASRRMDPNQHSALRRESVLIVRLQLTATLFLAVCGGAIVLLVVPDQSVAVACACLVLGLVNAWQMTGEQLARGLKQFIFSQFAFRVMLPSVALLCAFLWWACFGELSPLEALGAMAFALALVAAVCWTRSGATLASICCRKTSIDTSDSTAWLSARMLLSAGLPMLATSGLTILMSQLDVLMLCPLVGDAATGQYFAAARITVVVSLPLIAIDIVSATFYAEKHGAQDREAMNCGARRYISWIVPLSLASGVLLIWFCPVILRLFGEHYSNARGIVALLVVGHWVNALAGSSSVFLSMTGQEKASMLIFGAAGLANVTLNGVLIPRFGAMGAAAATAVSLGLWNIGAVVWMRRKTGVDTSIINFIWPPIHKMKNNMGAV